MYTPRMNSKPKRRWRKLAVKMSASMLEQWKAYCAALGVNPSVAVRQAIIRQVGDPRGQTDDSAQDVASPTGGSTISAKSGRRTQTRVN